MIFKIAEPPPGGKGFVGIYPEWDADGEEDTRILRASRQDYFSILFTRNYPGQFFKRIGPALMKYGADVDIVCGWEEEKIYMNFLPLNPEVEVFPISAMHFNTFDLIHQVREEKDQGKIPITNDVFFALSDRPDGLKQVPWMTELLADLQHSVRIIGYGRLGEEQLAAITGNPRLAFTWNGKADITEPGQRLAFLRDLARSRVLLVPSRVEGYSRLIGEALLLGVPILMNAQILCENWLHLNSRNCRLFNEYNLHACLVEMLEGSWDFSPPVYPEGNQLLRESMEAYLEKRNLPRLENVYPLSYGAMNSRVMTGKDLP